MKKMYHNDLKDREKIYEQSGIYYKEVSIDHFKMEKNRYEEIDSRLLRTSDVVERFQYTHKVSIEIAGNINTNFVPIIKN
jgi:hypothetical protein